MHRMIIVDDEYLELELLSALHLWDQYNISVLQSFDSPVNALAYLKDNPVDIIISDIRMPDMSGIEFLKEVRKNYPAILFVFITAYNDFQYTHTAIIYNVFDYLVKPIDSFDIENLCERMVGRLLDNRTAHESNYSAIKCQQALIDYFTGKSPGLKQLEAALLSQNIRIDPSSSIAVFQLTITNFTDFIASKWTYGLDRLYISLNNLMPNDIVCFLPLSYDYNRITILAASSFSCTELRNHLQRYLDRYLDNCNSIFELQLTYTIMALFENFPLAEEALKKILHIELLEDSFEKNDRNLNIEKTLAYIENNYHRDISLNEIAGHLSLTPYHVSRLFKKHMGDTFVNYLNQFRINKAKELLLTTNIKIADIVNLSGYMNKSHFFKTFQHYCGLTPSEYRNKYTKL